MTPRRLIMQLIAAAGRAISICLSICPGVPGDSVAIQVAAGRQAGSAFWLLPAAMTFVGFCEKVFSFGSGVSALCLEGLQFARTFWLLLFASLGSLSPLSVDETTADLLTFWVSWSLAIWLLPIVSKSADGRLMTTVDVVEGLSRAPPLFARPVALVMITLSVLILITPFGALPQTQTPSTLLSDILQESQLATAFGLGDWLSSDGIGVSIALLLLAAALYGYNFFVLGPRLAGAVLSAAERRDLQIIAIILWLLSASLLILALFVSPQASLLGFGRADVMALSLLSLVGVVAWRTALPFVQLVILVSAILMIGGIWDFLTSVATASRAL